jgi:hypothetical protein
MRVDMLSIPDAAHAVSAPAISASSQPDKPSFSDALARSTLAASTPPAPKRSTSASEPARSTLPSPATQSAACDSSPDSRSTSRSQSIASMNAKSGNEPKTSFGTRPVSESTPTSSSSASDESDAKENVRAGTQTGAMPGPRFGTKPGTNTRIANANTKTNTKPGAQPEAQPTANSRLAWSGITAPQLAAISPNLITNLALPVLPPISAPVATSTVASFLESATALASPDEASAIPTSAATTAAPAIALPSGSNPQPVPSLPSSANGPSPPPSSAMSVTASSPSKNPAMANTPENSARGAVSFRPGSSTTNVAPANGFSNPDFVEKETSAYLAHAPAFLAPGASASGWAANMSGFIPSSVPGSVPNSVPSFVPGSAPSSNPSALASPAAPSPASDSGLGTIGQPIPSSIVPIFGNSGVTGEAVSAGIGGNAVNNTEHPSNALTGDVPCPPSEPAPPASASLSTSTAVSFSAPAVAIPSAASPTDVVAAASPGAPRIAPNVARVNDPASGSNSLASHFRLPTFDVAAPGNPGPQPSAARPETIKQPVPFHNEGSKPVASSLRDFVSLRGFVAASSPSSADGTAEPQSAGNATNAAALPAVSGTDVAPLANPFAGSTTSFGIANYTPDSNTPASGIAGPKDSADSAGHPPQPDTSTITSLESPPDGKKASATSNSAAPSPGPASAHNAPSNASIEPLVTPMPATSASASPALEKSSAPSELPRAHQMLDSAPVPSANDPASAMSAAHLPPDPAVVQMHVGIRTSAFGNVEIHTVVEQSQVGVAIHGDHDVARWFNSEVGSLEAGLKSQHLNLTGVDFSSNRSGVQTATSFQQGQPQQNSSHTSGSNAAALPKETSAPESETEPVPASLPAESREPRVSILV